MLPHSIVTLLVADDPKNACRTLISQAQNANYFSALIFAKRSRAACRCSSVTLRFSGFLKDIALTGTL